MTRRLGLFGGTFDPPHMGHVAAVRAAVATGRFDLIEVTVAGDPYQKSAVGHVAPAEARLAMARAAFGEMPGVTVSDREVRREGPSYTIDTVREELDDFDEVDLIVGADLLAHLPSWREAATLATLVHVGVVPRPGGEMTFPEGWRCYEIPMAPVDLSSTFLRGTTPQSWRENVPAAVIPLYEALQR